MKTAKIREKIAMIFKDFNFAIDIITNLVEVNFMDVTFNLTNKTYWPYKKHSDEIKYINVLSNHLPQILNQLLNTIKNRLSRKSEKVKKCSRNLKALLKMHWIKVVIKLGWNIRYHQHWSEIRTKIEKEILSGSILLKIKVFKQT